MSGVHAIGKQKYTANAEDIQAQARHVVASGGLSMNGRKVQDMDEKLERHDLLEGVVAIMRIGKSVLRVIEVQ